MAKHTCPNCQHTFTSAPARKAGKPAVGLYADTSQMTTAEMFAYYKKVAPIRDLTFFLADQQLSDNLRTLAQAAMDRFVIDGTGPTPSVLAALRASWRQERNAADRADGIPAIGAPEWAAAYREADEAMRALKIANGQYAA